MVVTNNNAHVNDQSPYPPSTADMRKQTPQDSSSSSPLLLYTTTTTSDQTYVVLQPLYPSRPLRRPLTLAFSLILLSSLSIFLLFPSDPTLSLARIRLNRFNIRTLPRLSLSVSLSLALRVRNRDFFSFDYSSLDVSVGYRGKKLGVASSEGGKIKARATSYLNATLDLDGLEVIHDVVYLLADLAKGSVPFDTESEVKGSVGILFFRFPIKGRIACEVFVNTKNQTIMHQDCHPE